MEIGAPSDEYYDLVDNMIGQIDQPNEEDIKMIIIDTFGRLIDMVDSKDKFLQKVNNMTVEISNLLTK